MDKQESHLFADARFSEKLIGHSKYATSLFHGINTLQKEGLFCDTTVNSGSLKNVPAHKIVLLGAKKTLHRYGKSGSTSSDGMDYHDDVNFVDAYIPDEDELVFTDKEQHVASTETLNHEHLAEDRLTAINNLRRQTEGCDVTIKINNEEYAAHKVVLAAASNYFYCMFKDNLREKYLNVIDLNKMNELDCLDTSYMADIISYIYTGKISLTYDKAWNILYMAIYLQIDNLVKDCELFLMSHVCLSTCCELSHLSSVQCLNELRALTNNYIHDHFCEIEGVDSHLDLIEQEQVIQYLKSSTLGGNKSSTTFETQILKNVLSWMTINKALRNNELLLNVRLPLISKEVLEQNGHDTSFSDTKVWKEALLYHDKIYEQPLLQTPNSELRTNVFNWVCIDGVLAPSTLKLPSCSQYITPYGENFKSTKVSQAMHKNIRDPFHSVIEFNGFIYTLGGTRYTSEGYSNEVIRYDPRLDKSIAVAPMNENRGDFYCCVHDDHIYVFGGRNKHGALSTCERYDPRTNTWEYIASFEDSGLYMMAGEVCKDSIIISGGFSDEEAVASVQKFNCNTQKWEPLYCQLWCERGYHVMVKAEDKLYIIGGVDNPFAGRNVWDVEVFDPETEDVQPVGQVLPIQPFLSVQRLNALVNDDGDICIFAVTNTKNSSFMKFSIEKNMWETINSPINLYEIFVNILPG